MSVYDDLLRLVDHWITLRKRECMMWRNIAAPLNT